MAAVGERNPQEGRRSRGGGDAGNDFEGNACSGKGIRFLATAAEDEWIAPLQAHDRLPLAREGAQARVCLGLRPATVSRLLADKHTFAAWPGLGKDRRGYQVIVNDGVGRTEQAKGLPCR